MAELQKFTGLIVLGVVLFWVFRDAQGTNNNPLCTNHPSCIKGTWVYWRMD